MTADKVDAMEKKKDEQFQRAINRPFYYGYPAVGKTVYAYTKEEWGIGASSGGGDHNLIRSLYFSLFMAVVMAPVSLFCLLLGILALLKLPIMALVMVFFGVLFGFAFLQCWFNVTQELREGRPGSSRDCRNPGGRRPTTTPTNGSWNTLIRASR
ncbi:hypothetical protein ACW0JT_15365 [Arthrobacter sp. SA17]